MFTIQPYVRLVLALPVAACALGTPAGGGDPAAVSRAVSSVNPQCSVSLGSAEVISAEMAGMPVGMTATMPGGNVTEAAAAVAQRTGCFAIIANDPGVARARSYSGHGAAKPDYVISVSRQTVMPTYGEMMATSVINPFTLGTYAMSGKGGASTSVTVTVTDVRTETSRTGSATEHDAAVAAAEATIQAVNSMAPSTRGAKPQ
jgi:hypothetical protein